jgi:hypothetical protein
MPIMIDSFCNYERAGTSSSYLTGSYLISFCVHLCNSKVSCRPIKQFCCVPIIPFVLAVHHSKLNYSISHSRRNSTLSRPQGPLAGHLPCVRKTLHQFAVLPAGGKSRIDTACLNLAGPGVSNMSVGRSEIHGMRELRTKTKGERPRKQTSKKQ